MSKGLRPGEWIILEDQLAKKNYIAYINPFAESFYKLKILTEDKTKKYNVKSDEEEVARELIVANLQAAFKLRDYLTDYSNGARLVYGMNDSLPGIIVDKYQKYILAQINTAGMDRFRDLIKAEIVKKYPEQKVLFFDNLEYRKSEVLPVHEPEKIAEDLDILENGIHYRISQTVMQKIGYYYDHRENRSKLANLLTRTSFPKKTGLDLFSYVGSWGLHMLKAGVENVEFVDQANMEVATNTNLELNNFKGRGQFTRSDVFKFLDTALASGKKYDVIVSDPPAFTKSEKNKIQALQGYEKLHLKAMRLLSDEGLMVVASCTHHVNYEELDKTVQEAALKNSQRVQLLDLGVQGMDHPFSGFKDKSFYIKYLVYFVSRG
ncbi:class I SAM-dependent methyltransferase [Bacteriovorax sp. PP10]|uniref:Class I SAM-dependent methyltransferase n=1 Tax=Bacteriovorax antarcticus TaxID=3088717 RepID=A0ABU5VNR9_9BACT|nr:class I SAM-dependent methyltransferase [Bacteriovorax sp. PP10]MEA9354679.1 class I SAM-dependent methyltransferase [Bacteriovorax sp. PP10]